MAGIPVKEFSHINYEAFVKQATEFKGLDYDAMNKVIKFLSIVESSHPWTVMRAAELLNWISTGKYESYVPPKSNVFSDITSITKLLREEWK